MNKVSYANLKLKTNLDVNTFEFQGQTIEVLKYLSIEDKYDCINITLQKAFERGVYNPVKLHLYFNLNLVYLYTNLSFTDKQRENETKLYDALESNGLIEKILVAIPEEEYNFLFDTLYDTIEANMQYKNSVAAMVQSLIQDLPGNAEAAMKIVEQFDPQKYQQVVDFATAANGGRPIPRIVTNNGNAQA